MTQRTPTPSRSIPWNVFPDDESTDSPYTELEPLEIHHDHTFAPPAPRQEVRPGHGPVPAGITRIYDVPEETRAYAEQYHRQLEFEKRLSSTLSWYETTANSLRAKMQRGRWNSNDQARLVQFYQMVSRYYNENVHSVLAEVKDQGILKRFRTLLERFLVLIEDGEKYFSPVIQMTTRTTGVVVPKERIQRRKEDLRKRGVPFQSFTIGDKVPLHTIGDRHRGIRASGRSPLEEEIRRSPLFNKLKTARSHARKGNRGMMEAALHQAGGVIDGTPPDIVLPVLVYHAVLAQTDPDLLYATEESLPPKYGDMIQKAWFQTAVRDITEWGRSAA
jgi:hypothetical protein